MTRLKWLGGSAIVTCGLIAIWELLTTTSGIVPALFLPAPGVTFLAFADGIASGDGVKAAAITVGRMLAGWLSAAALGIVVGGIVASSRLLSELLVPTLEFFRQIPSSAKLPIVILFMGLTTQMIVVVIALGALWPVMLATIQGFRSVEPALLETARILQMSKFATFAKISLPSALPDIFAGLRISLTVSLILAVVGEILTGLPGVGATIMQASVLYRTPELYAGIVMLGIIGFVCNALLMALSGRLIRR